jgi:hypothetical protein
MQDNLSSVLEDDTGEITVVSETQLSDLPLSGRISAKRRALGFAVQMA